MDCNTHYLQRYRYIYWLETTTVRAGKHSPHSCLELIAVIVGGLHILVAVKVCRRPSCGALRQTAACSLSVTWPTGLQVTFTSRERLHKYALITRNYALPFRYYDDAEHCVGVRYGFVHTSRLITRPINIHQPLYLHFITVNDLLRRFFLVNYPCKVFSDHMHYLLNASYKYKIFILNAVIWLQKRVDKLENALTENWLDMSLDIIHNT